MLRCRSAAAACFELLPPGEMMAADHQLPGRSGCKYRYSRYSAVLIRRLLCRRCRPNLPTNAQVARHEKYAPHGEGVWGSTL